MICEIRTGAIDSPRVGFLETERTLNRLMSVGGETADYWSLRLGLAAELAIVQEDAHGRSEASKAMLPSLNGPRSCFVRDVLGEWCAGYLGVTADEPLARAVGLDENWRVRALEWMEAGSEFVPVWMRVEGLDAKLTGSGYLRKLEDGGREQFLAEFVLTHSLIWTVKLIWLDLVSCLGKGHWYSLSALTELMQLAMSFGIFGQVVQVLERPEECLYLPVQRSSFLADPFHSTEIASWVRQVITDLWEPLGIAKVCEETDQVWLDSPMMRIEGPPILDPAARREFLAEVMDNPDFEFHVPGLAPAILRAVGEEEQEGDWVEMSCPLDVILDRVEGRTIQSFDGKRLKLTSV
jgi:hypothetical protein